MDPVFLRWQKGNAMENGQSVHHRLTSRFQKQMKLNFALYTGLRKRKHFRFFAMNKADLKTRKTWKTSDLTDLAESLFLNREIAYNVCISEILMCFVMPFSLPAPL